MCQCQVMPSWWWKNSLSIYDELLTRELNKLRYSTDAWSGDGETDVKVEAALRLSGHGPWKLSGLYCSVAVGLQGQTCFARFLPSHTHTHTQQLSKTALIAYTMDHTDTENCCRLRINKLQTDTSFKHHGGRIKPGNQWSFYSKAVLFK